MQVAARQPGTFALEAALALGLVALTAAGAIATVTLGMAALALPVLVLAVVLAIAAPHELGLILLAAVIAVEPGALDASGSLAPLLYELPPGLDLGLTMNPMEVGIVAACASAVVRAGGLGRIRVPVVAALIPLAMVVGFMHGLRTGGDANLAYNEARGLIYGSAAFVLASLAPMSMVRRLQVCVLGATGILATLVIYRYLAFVKPGDMEVPVEFAFAHEDSIFLGVGLVLGGTMLARPGVSIRDRILLICYVLVVAAAMAATQRRAATLVGLTGVGAVAALLFTKRPVMVIVAGLPLLALFAVYLAANWDREYGTIAQPARAVRSQIDPSPRDESSDQYRDTERMNVIETVRLNRLLGVGFGQPFAQFRELPNLEAFWPLQRYTPHQNILWLWLKLGLIGLAGFIALVTLALARCVAVVRESRLVDDRALLGMVVAGTLLMYIAFATVDQALVGTRGAITLAVALAVAFSLPERRQSRAAGTRADP